MQAVFAEVVVMSFVLGCSMAQKYNCPRGTPGWPCLRGSDGNPLTIRVLFMDKAYVTSNPAAITKVTSMGRQYIAGSTCDDAATAVPECFVFENWNGGWIGSYMNTVLKEVGFNVIALTKANFSSAAKAVKTGSSFTRCVWDVKYGNVDLCVGDFWETPERRNLTTFTTPLDSDAFTLYTTRNPKAIPPEFDESMFLLIFLPFDNAVWLLFAFFIIAAAVVLRFVDGPNDAAERRVLFSPLAQHRGDTSKLWWALNTLDDVLEGIWDGLMAFLGGADKFIDAANKWPGRFVCAALGLFVFVHVNTYTGNLAAYYVRNNNVQLGLVKSLDDIRSVSGNLCLYQSMASATKPIIAQAGISDSQLILMDNYGPMLERLYQGDCLGAVVGKFERHTFISAASVTFNVCMDPDDANHWTSCANKSVASTVVNLNPATCGSQCTYAKRYCDFIALQDDLIDSITLSWELPVRAALEPWISFAIIRLHTTGNLSVIQTRELLTPNPVVCTQPGLPSIAVGVGKLSGTFLLCGGFLAIGFFTHVGMLIYAAYVRRRHPERETALNVSRLGSRQFSITQPEPAAGNVETGSTGSEEAGVGRGGGLQRRGKSRVDRALEGMERVLAKMKQL